jgi:hypothetical protein
VVKTETTQRELPDAPARGSGDSSRVWLRELREVSPKCPRNAHDKTAIERQIAATDRQIDALCMSCMSWKEMRLWQHRLWVG